METKRREKKTRLPPLNLHVSSYGVIVLRDGAPLGQGHHKCGKTKFDETSDRALHGFRSVGFLNRLDFFPHYLLSVSRAFVGRPACWNVESFHFVGSITPISRQMDFEGVSIGYFVRRCRPNLGR